MTEKRVLYGCEDCGHKQYVLHSVFGHREYAGSGASFCDECDGVVHRVDPPDAPPMASYTLSLVADSGYESTMQGRCTAEQYSDAIGALHGSPGISIEHMVNRFLGWKLPANFAPDGGISFNRGAEPPIGTNLLTAEQAREMFQYCIGMWVQLPPVTGRNLVRSDDEDVQDLMDRDMGDN